ncbi:hypothetical protein NQ317_016808 [Molorchus minor]|uniref:Uncharacterized protein n=1 Tax=Molorchus minor TaxID=1323400 RepID=A0ABQ9JGZ2_9CUCU|nr:hypothetical protein NQ317_016808 [Molorchus minor]
MPETPRTETPTSSTSYTLTDEQMTSLLTSMQQSQLQLLNQLVQNISPIQTRTGNFVDCTARFNGKKEADIEAFLDAVCIYKDCAKVTDENAIRGLPMLLTDEAATYWQGVKSSIHNWEDALKSLRSAYSVKLAPYRVYRELFEREQTDTETTELFVSKARALLAQLPDTDVLSEKIKLDMIYGLLNKRIRKRLTRDSVNTFGELLKGARSIEQSLAESQNKTSENSESNNDKRKPKRTRCVYCKSFGHEVSECLVVKRKNEKSTQLKTTNVERTEDTSGRPKISCYGCGAAGVIRSRCTRCNPATTSAATVVVRDESVRSASVETNQFYSADVTTNIYERPILAVYICGLNGTAYADTGASCSIIGCNLYHRIKDQCTFRKENRKVTLADGSQVSEEILTTTLDVTIQQRVVRTNFVVLSTEGDNRTLLGADFLRNSSIILDMGLSVWYFKDAPQITYEFLDDVINPACEQSMVTSYNVELREDEATCLDNVQRKSLTELLSSFSTTFALGGVPTPYAEHSIIIKEGQTPIAVPPYQLTGKSAAELRAEQLTDPEVAKIIHSFEAVPSKEDLRHWIGRGYIMSNGILYHYSPETDEDNAPEYEPGSLVLLKSHVLSSSTRGISSKLVPKRDGPYKVLKEVTPSTYEIATLDKPTEPIGKYHVSEMHPFIGEENVVPMIPKRRRGRPKAGTCPRTLARTRGGRDVTPLPDPLGMEGHDRGSDSDRILIDIKYWSVLFNIFSDFVEEQLKLKKNRLACCIL